MTRTQSISRHKKIDVAITQTGDYLEGTNPISNIIFPWTSTPVKISGQPVVVQTVRSAGCAWSPNGEYLAVALNTSAFIVIYQRFGTTFTRLSGPSVGDLPAGLGTHIGWSNDSQFMAIAHNTSPRVTIYQKIGNLFSKLTNPTTLPTGEGRAAVFSPDSQFLAVAHNTTPFITVYRREATDFLKLSVSAPQGNADDCCWSPNGEFLVVGHANSSFIHIYQRNGVTFTKISGPIGSEIPTGTVQGVAFSPDGRYLACAFATSSFLAIYARSNTTFTKITNIDTIPQSAGQGVSWSPKGDYLVVSHASGLFTIYKREGSGVGASFFAQPDPADNPAGQGEWATFSPDGQFMAVAAFTSSVTISVYQTDKTPPLKGIVRTIGSPREGD